MAPAPLPPETQPNEQPAEPIPAQPLPQVRAPQEPEAISAVPAAYSEVEPVELPLAPTPEDFLKR